MNGKLKTAKNIILPVMAAAAMVLLILLIIDPAFSWLGLVSGKGLATVTRVETPVLIEIGTSDEGRFEPFDMGKIDVENNELHYQEYVFCVYSKMDPTLEYGLYLAHTTNIGFEYTLYRADQDGESGVIVEYLDEEYTKGTELTGKYLNLEPGSDLLAKTDDQYYLRTYGSYDNVQEYGVPLYWESDDTMCLSDGDDTVTIEETDYQCDYYILRVSWDPEKVVFNRKETDMVYIMAQSVIE